MHGANRGSPRLGRLADAVLQPGFTGTVPPLWMMRRLEGGFGGVALFVRNVESWEQIATLIATLRQANGDVTVAVDEETGDVTRLEARTGSTRPGTYALGTVDDTELTSAVAEDAGRALREAGVTLNYAPVADVNSNPRNPVMGARSFGSDPDLVARRTEAWLRGQQRAGVAAFAKHFPGHGDTTVDSHLETPVIAASRAELQATELRPFRVAIAAGVRAVVTGHLVVPALDPHQPASLSRAILTGLLRGELGFTGLVITDGIEMRAASARHGMAGAAVRALAAGANTICVGGEHADEATATMLRDAIVDAVLGGDLAEERLDEEAGPVAELVRWSRAQADRPWSDRRALRVSLSSAGTPLPLRRAPHVVEFSAIAHKAIGGDNVADLGRLLASQPPGTTTVRLRSVQLCDNSD